MNTEIKSRGAILDEVMAKYPHEATKGYKYLSGWILEAMEAYHNQFKSNEGNVWISAGERLPTDVKKIYFTKIDEHIKTLSCVNNKGEFCDYPSHIPYPPFANFNNYFWLDETPIKSNDVGDVKLIDGDWKLIGNSYQIADTGDYGGNYEITNGKISIFTNDDDEDALIPIVNSLNESGCKFYLDDAAEFELRLAKLEIEQLKQKSIDVGDDSDMNVWFAMAYGALSELCELKSIKDKCETEDPSKENHELHKDYLERKPKAWYAANQVIELWKKSDYGAKQQPIDKQINEFELWQDVFYEYDKKENETLPEVIYQLIKQFSISRKQ